MRDLLPIEAAKMPSALMICGASEDFSLVEAAGPDGQAPVKKFSIVGYTGGMIRLNDWPYPVVVDLEGMAIPRQQIPTLMSHDREKIVGHTTGIVKQQKKLLLEGVMSGHSDTEQTPSAVAAREVVRMARNQFNWQASIGASPDKTQFVPAGESFRANGQRFDGPAYLVSKSTLAEISFVAIGADMNTSANVAATAATSTILGGLSMEFSQWLAAKGLDQAAFAALPEAIRASLQSQHAAETKPAPAPAPAATVQAAAPQTTFDQKIAAIEAESLRIEYIRERTAEACAANVGNPAKIQQLRELCATAIEDKGTDKGKFDLALLRADRQMGPVIYQASEKPLDEEILAAAICATGKLPKYEEKFSERVLDAAHKHFPRGINLKSLLFEAARRNSNYRGSLNDDVALCRAAFVNAAGPSSIAVPGILSNVANKFLASGFLYTEQAWRQISKIRTANDFKQMSTYRLTGSNKFKKVAPGGEIKHGTLSELTYTNQVDTYGIMIGMDRRDIRNDDLGAFTSIPQELGRGAGDNLNEVFWTEYLDDSTFYPTDKSLLNYDDGATDSVLSLAGLENADTLFALQTKPDGTPLGVMPAILLVPRALRATATTLMAAAPTAAAQSTATTTLHNPWAGMFQVVSSVYLQSSAITGYSATAWYLLADPMNIPTIEVAFLDGIETPTVETSEFEFDRLGLSMRAYMDWGCNKQEYRGGVKLKGAA